MSKRFVWLKWIGVVLSVLWLAGFAILAGSEWFRREADRTYYYDQCLRQTPDVAKCQSLSAAVLRESFVDVSRDFLITGIALSISAFRAKFGLRVIWLSAVRYDPASSDRRSPNWSCFFEMMRAW